MTGWTWKWPARWTAAHAIGSAAAFAVVAAGAGVARAAEITLQMKGGGFTVQGDLRSYDGARYVIESKTLGTMTLDGARFECSGPGCPTAPVTAAPPKGTNLGTATFMGGSAQGTAVMPKLVQAYAKTIGATVIRSVGSDPKNLEFKLTDAAGKEIGNFIVARQGVPAGLAGLLARTVDVFWSARPITAEEQARGQALGFGNLRAPGNENVYALNAIAMVVAAENPVVSISIENIAKIYSGQINDWSELGLPPGKINVYAMVESSGVWGSFEDLVMKPRNLKARPDIIRIDASTDWSDKVAQDKSGIGITNIGIVRNSKALNVEASCGLIVRPSNFAAKTEEYPLMHRLHLYTSGTPKVPLARELLTFAMSPAMQPVLKEANFVDQSLEALDFQAQTARIAYALNAQTEDFDINMMRTMIGEVKAASRLSTTFRFGTADATLDSRANADIQRLADLLKTADYRNKQVLIIGFADAIGSFASNLKLSERRAAAVLRALTVSAGIGVRSQVTTRAYGELAPVACNDTPEARNYNRRVEVWIKN
ncbi:MAG: phosphate ABC transporter substrate-binding/OmpA family protein [Hyphomicrobium sp.]